MKRSRLVCALVAGALVAFGCATSETDVGQGYGGSGNFGGKPLDADRPEGGQGGSKWGAGGSGAVGGSGATAGSTAFGGSSGVGSSGGVGASGGGSGTGGSSGVGGSSATGGVGGSSATGGVGGSSATGGVGGSSGVGGSATGGSSGVGGTGGSTSSPPTTCAQAHGAVGCCVNNDLYFWECAALQGGPGSCNGQPCGWDATNKWYACGFSGADPSGVNPKNCGIPNPSPATCPGTSCCAGICGSTSSPSGCACDSLCTFFGDCCPDACQLCGAC